MDLEHEHPLFSKNFDLSGARGLPHIVPAVRSYRTGSQNHTCKAWSAAIAARLPGITGVGFYPNLLSSAWKKKVYPLEV